MMAGHVEKLSQGSHDVDLSHQRARKKIRGGLEWGR